MKTPLRLSTITEVLHGKYVALIFSKLLALLVTKIYMLTGMIGTITEGLTVADFKKLIGAAHATEIPLLAGNSDLVGGYPLSDLIYPPSFSRDLHQKLDEILDKFRKDWNFGTSSNSIEWKTIPFKFISIRIYYLR